MDGRSKRRGRSPLAWRGLQPSTALLATGQSLCQVSTYRPTWIFSGLRRNDRGPAFSFFASLWPRRDAKRTTILRISSSIYPDPSFRSQVFPRPLHSYTYPVRCFRFIDQNLGRVGTRFRIRSVLDATFFFNTLLGSTFSNSDYAL